MPETEKSAFIKRRLRQGEFRRGQIYRWVGCAVSGCTVEAVLEACHIKPWNDFPSERLDAENGLCLTANLHKLFDAGLITFEDDGRMSVSDQISQEDQAILMLKGRVLRKSLTPQQQSNLVFHREYHRK
jgi:predicted restriction endonuclease